MKRQRRERMAVYLLFVDGQLWPFYVGITNNPDQRLKQHRQSATSRTYDVGKHIAAAGPENIRMNVVAWADGRFNARLVERSLIRELQEQRVELVNMDDTTVAYVPPPLQ